MSNITRIENPFTQSDFDDAMTALDILGQTLDETKGLSPRAKSRLFRMGKANLGFVEAASRSLKAMPNVRPAYLDPQEFEKDLMLVRNSKALRLKLLEIANRMEDTELLVGDHAFRSSLAIYRVVQSAFRTGFAGIEPYYEEMRERWPSTAKMEEESLNADPDGLAPVDVDQPEANDIGQPEAHQNTAGIDAI